MLVNPHFIFKCESWTAFHIGSYLDVFTTDSTMKTLNTVSSALPLQEIQLWAEYIDPGRRCQYTT